MASDSLAAALAAFQAEIPRIEKDKAAVLEGESKTTGKKFTYGYKYADLANVTAIVMPLLGKQGLSFTSCPKLSGNGFVLHYKLRHTSGESDEGEWPLPDPIRTKPQAVASAITYARRYSLYAATGVAPDDEDDDAAEAQQAHGRPDGLPVNKDGSLSRSQTTDAEKDAAANMTSAQWAEHTALQKDADGKLPAAEHAKVEKIPATPPDDPWLDTPPSDTTPREERPGTASRAQLDHIFGQFDQLGYAKDDRDGRIKLTREIVGRDVKSSANLSLVEAAQLTKRLDGLLKEAETVSP